LIFRIVPKVRVIGRTDSMTTFASLREPNIPAIRLTNPLALP
jgi:hypothetical protein